MLLTQASKAREWKSSLPKRGVRMLGSGTPSKPDLGFQSARVTQFFILPKRGALRFQNVTPETLATVSSAAAKSQVLYKSSKKTKQNKKTHLFWNTEWWSSGWSDLQAHSLQLSEIPKFWHDGQDTRGALCPALSPAPCRAAAGTGWGEAAVSPRCPAAPLACSGLQCTDQRAANCVLMTA